MTDKWADAMEGLDDLRTMLEEIVEVGERTAGSHQIVIDAAHGLEGLDRAEEALIEWREPPEMEVDTQAAREVLSKLEEEGIVGKKRGEEGGIEYELSPLAEQMFDENDG